MYFLKKEGAIILHNDNNCFTFIVLRTLTYNLFTGMKPNLFLFVNRFRKCILNKVGRHLTAASVIAITNLICS